MAFSGMPDPGIREAESHLDASLAFLADAPKTFSASNLYSRWILPMPSDRSKNLAYSLSPAFQSGCFRYRQKKFNYNDGDPQLMSAILQRSTGKAADAWADEVLFSKIGVTNYNWVRYKDGTSLGGFGIETTPREMGKIAICVADSGRAGEQQIVSAQWITEMTSPQIEVSDAHSFGYYWWIDPSRNIYFMWGHDGQFAFIIPDYQLIVVMSSISNTQGDYQIQADEALPVVNKIINACY